MMETLLICGYLVGPARMPNALVQDLYAHSVGCQIAATSPHAERLIPPENLNDLFPASTSFWPVFTGDAAQERALREYLRSGVKPGLLLPADLLDLNKPWVLMRYRRAAAAGAIPILQISKPQQDIAAMATLAAAFSLEPQAVWVTKPIAPSLTWKTASTYISDAEADENRQQLPWPNREIAIAGNHYYAGHHTLHAYGFAVIKNPPTDWIGVVPIRHPQLGMHWKFGETPFETNTELSTSLFGRLVLLSALFTGMIAAPFVRPLPSFFSLMGYSLSWLSIVVGAVLLLILLTGVYRNRKRGHT